jgi:hypothetical protein
MGKVSDHVEFGRAICRPGIMQPSGVLANHSRQIRIRPMI